jgi:hypothetical protein
VSVVSLIVATRSSGLPASGKIIKEMSGSVASGTLYTIRNSSVGFQILFNVFSKFRSSTFSAYNGSNIAALSGNDAGSQLLQLNLNHVCRP